MDPNNYQLLCPENVRKDKIMSRGNSNGVMRPDYSYNFINFKLFYLFKIQLSILVYGT
jgi:hypothetical protein